MHSERKVVQVSMRSRAQGPHNEHCDTNKSESILVDIQGQRPPQNLAYFDFLDAALAGKSLEAPVLKAAGTFFRNEGTCTLHSVLWVTVASQSTLLCNRETCSFGLRQGRLLGNMQHSTGGNNASTKKEVCSRHGRC